MHALVGSFTAVVGLDLDRLCGLVVAADNRVENTQKTLFFFPLLFVVIIAISGPDCSLAAWKDLIKPQVAENIRA